MAPAGHSFNISVGAQVPPSIELNYLPIAALSQAPEARALKYTIVQNQVVLVDPTNMRIIDVIRPGQENAFSRAADSVIGPLGKAVAHRSCARGCQGFRTPHSP